MRLSVGPATRTGVALRRIAMELALESREVLIGCWVALAHRHLRQVDAGVRISTGDAGPQLLTCSVRDGCRIGELIAAAAHAWRAATPALECAAILDVALAIECDAAGTPEHMVLTGTEPLVPVMRVLELGAQLECLVVAAAADPRQDVLDCSLLTDAARELLPDPALPIATPHHATVSQLVLQAARCDPQQIAVATAHRHHSYAELVGQARAVSAELARLGVRAGDVVAASGPRSFQIVSAMLGIFFHGAVLLTLDPKLPGERRRLMCREARAKLLLFSGTGTDLPGELPSIELETLRTHLCEGTPIDDAPEGGIHPQAPAFIFFTSGSTGAPKGVVGTHAGLAHFLDWQRRTFAVGRTDRGAQTIALSFDAVLRDVFLVLGAGGTLCIPAEEDLLDPAAILSWLAREQISLLHVVPSLLRTWLTFRPEHLGQLRLRYLFLSGEPVTDVLVQRCRECFGSGTQIVNLYGPTETTMVKCFHRLGPLQPGVQPVGQPMPQTQVLILNPRQRLCALEEPGHIAIRTPFRTLGYLNSPEATARAFIRNPFAAAADDLIYLTGDIGRYRADGVLEVMGRMDHQVKIRGVRVEPGEVEYAICQHPSVREATVKAHEDAAGGKSLAAYVVLAEATADRAEAIARLRRDLQRRLPEHLVPASFTLLERFPLTTTGKLDLNALPAPARGAHSIAEADLAATPLERCLVAIWAGVLGVPTVGVNDGFGALGGDSLTSVGVLVEMERIGVPHEAAKGIFCGGSIREIASRAQALDSPDGKPHRWSEIEIPILVRALSIVLMVMGHAGAWDVQGSIKALLIVSGYSFARFQLQAIGKRDSIAPVGRFALRLALPTWLYTALLGIVVLHALRPLTALLVDNLVDPRIVGSPWYIELLLQCIGLTAAPLALRPVRRFALERPYVYGLLFTFAWWSASRLVPLVWNTDHLYNRVPQILLWMMAFGWCAAFSNTTRRKLLSSLALVLGMRYTYEWFGWYPLVTGLSIIWLERLPLSLPRQLVAAVNTTAAASLFIYLSHMQLVSVARKHGLNACLAVVIAVIGGIVLWRGWDLCSRMASRSWRMRSPVLAVEPSS